MSTNAALTASPPNWYRDPQDATLERYWDGANWTGYARPLSSGFTAMPGQPFPTADTSSATTGNGFSIAAIILGAIAFLFLPIVFGPIGLILGAVAKSKGESKANTALIVSGLGLVIGMIFGAIVGMATL